MANFLYTAKAVNGDTVKGSVEASNVDQALNVIRQNNLTPITITENKKGMFNNLSFGNLFGKVSEGDVAIFTRQLSSMVNAGLPFAESMNILKKQTKNAHFAEVLDQVGKDVEGGTSLGGAMAKHPDVFGRVYINLVKAGEAGGVIDKIFLRLADSLEKSRSFHSKVKGALLYPVILLVLMFVVMFVMMIFVIPKLADLYKDIDASLPLPTLILIGISDFFVNFWYLIIGGIIGLIMFYRYWGNTEAGRAVFDDLKLKIPVFGRINRGIILVEFTRTLGLLLEAGVPIIESLRVSTGIVNNVNYEKSLLLSIDKIEKGAQLYDQIEESEIFPPIVSQMVKVGEETGKLDDVLNRLANYFENEADQLVKNVTTALEPFILVILGLGVGLLVISIILPIYNLTSKF